MTKVIEAAKAQRLRNPAHVDTSKAVKYPIMNAFNKEEFLRTRKEWFEATKQSSHSGIFSSFKSCLSLTVQNAAKGVFHLSEDRFIQIEDELFMNWCALHFEPSNKKEALRLLKSVKIYHRDVEHEQSEFLKKFDQVCYDHEMAVNDIVDSQAKWPFDEDDIDCSGLTAKEIAREWKEVYPKQEGSRVFCVQMRKCRNFIEQNSEMAFNEQVSKLRASFAKKDNDVANDSDVYSTTPNKRIIQQEGSRSRECSETWKNFNSEQRGNSRWSEGEVCKENRGWS